MKYRILVIIGLIIFSVIFFSGCLNNSSTSQSDLDQSLVGTWESGVVNGYYIHQKILTQGGLFTSRWLYASDRSTYSTVSGTWTADGSTLTTVTDHTDTYSYSFIGSDTIRLQWDGESRTYYRQ